MTIIDDRVIVVAGGALVLALFAAAVIRQAAISILADAGQSHVSIAWPIFLLLTTAVFHGRRCGCLLVSAPNR